MKNITNLCIELQEGKVSKKDFLREARIAFPNYITNVNTFQDTINILKRKNLISEQCNCENQIDELWEPESEEDELDMRQSKIKSNFNNVEPAEPDEQDLEILDNLDLFVDDDMNEIQIRSNFKISDGWSENEIDENWANDEMWEGELVKHFSAPMEGYSEDHDDNIYVIKTSDNQYKIEIGYAFSDIESEEKMYSNLSQALDRVYEIMEEIKEDWGEDEDEGYYEDELNESKKQPKQKLTALEVDPHELRMGMRVEKEHTPDLDKRMKIALDHLSEDPFYYTKLHLAGLDDSKMEKSNKKRTDLPTEVDKKMSNMVDKVNQMISPKGIEKDKASDNKAHKETNKIVSGVKEFTHKSTRAKGIKGVMDMTGGKMKKIKALNEMTMINKDKFDLKYILQTMINTSFKSESHDIRLEDKGNKVMLKYGYWEDLPLNILNKIESKFSIEKDDSDHKVFYIISPKITSEMMNEIKNRIKKLLKNK